MPLSCEARVKLTLSLGLIILVVVCAVITVVVLKATTDDPDAACGNEGSKDLKRI